MKKLFAVLAVAAFMVACNNGTGTEETTTDSTTTVAPVDSTVAPVTVDTTAPVVTDSSAVDTTKK